jgi:Putative lumazine-binding
MTLFGMSASSGSTSTVASSSSAHPSSAGRKFGRVRVPPVPVAVELAAWCGVDIVVGVAEEESKVADRDAIVRVALDYFEGWFDGDAARMERTLHPDLAKRSPDDAPAPGELEKLTAREMIEATAKGIGKTRDVPDRGLEVEVEHLHREIANVTVRSAVYVEYLHLVRTRDGWKIVNALWQHP